MVGLGVVRGVNKTAPLVGSAMRKAIASTGVADTSIRSAPSLSGGNTIVYVTVQGSVTTEKKLAEAIAPTVRDAIVRKGRLNGGRTGL